MTRRILLLTDMPPCGNFTAGLVTAQLCRAVPRGELAMFCVLNRHLRPEPCPDLDWIPSVTVPKPTELGRRSVRGIPLPEAAAVAIELAKRWILAPRLVRQAIAFGREQGATAVWAVLQGQTMVRMALPVARGLGVPLLVQVWDPLSWWLREHGVDRLNSRLDLAAFDRTMRAAAGCAAASWAMAELYRERYGTPGEPVIAALDRAVARRPAPGLRRGDEVVIGMAGQFYAVAEWLELLRALSLSGWQVSGRQVRLRVLGNHQPPGEVPPDRLDMLGWRPQAEAVALLSETCDVLYCGYPFAGAMAEVSRLSFPSKLPTYFAAGRPVLFHGPRDSSPGTYLARRGAASIAPRLAPDAVYNALLALVEDEGFYRAVALAGRAAFEADFTLERQAAAMRRFLALAEGSEARRSGGR